MNYPGGIKELLQLPREVRECPEVMSSIRSAIEKDDEALLHYVRWMWFEATLHGMLHEHSDASASIVSEIRRSRRRRFGLIFSTVSLVMVICVGAYFSLFRSNAANVDVAEVISATDSGMAGRFETTTEVIWNNSKFQPPQTLQVGSRFSARQGSFELHLGSGAIVTCSAPIDVEVKSGWELYLHYGDLSAFAPTRARGFCVNTVGGRVVDLGTFFHVHVNDSGGTEVHVLNGTVSLQSHQGDSVNLHAGVSRSLERDGRIGSPLPAQIDLIPAPFRLPDGIAFVKGNIHVLPAAPDSVRPGKFVTARSGWIFQEQARVTVSSHLKLFAPKPGVYDKSPPPLATIPAGTTVSTYLIHVEELNGRPVEGEISFTSPILGFAISGSQLKETDAEYGSPGTLYSAKDARGFLENADLLEIRPDGKTIFVKLKHFEESGLDQIRVFIEP